MGGWPLLFARRDLKSPNLTIRKGEPFPFQDMRVLRGFGAAFGVDDAFTCPAEQLDYIEIVDVGTQFMQRRVMHEGLTASAVKKLLGETHAA